MEAGVWVDGHVDWALAHEELERLAKERGELDGREGLALLRKPLTAGLSARARNGLTLGPCGRRN